MFSININIAVATVVLILELGGLSFIALKIKEKDKIITYHCQSLYYPIFYVVIQTLTALVAVLTFTSTSYAIFIILLPEAITIFFYIRFRPYGNFKSFNNIAGLYCQLLPPITAGLLILNQYIEYSLLPTITSFTILGLLLIG